MKLSSHSPVAVRRGGNTCGRVSHHKNIVVTNSASIKLDSASLQASSGFSLSSQPSPVTLKFPLLSRVSAAVELQAAIQKFESFAGRAAMIGFVACAVGEMVVDVPSVQQTDPAAVLASLLLALTTATIMALTRQRLAGGLLLEPVLASLTSAQRSASSLTNIGPGRGAFDAAVDKVFDEAFDNSKVGRLLRCSDSDYEYNDLLL